MWLLYLEIAVGLLLFILIVWWTLPRHRKPLDDAVKAPDKDAGSGPNGGAPPTT